MSNIHINVQSNDFKENIFESTNNKNHLPVNIIFYLLLVLYCSSVPGKLKSTDYHPKKLVKISREMSVLLLLGESFHKIEI